MSQLHHPPAEPLVDRLKACAALWTAAHDGTLARLGRLVVNDGGFFTRLETQPQGTTTATLERFARFLGEPVNWPDAVVPAEVREFVRVVGAPPLGAAAQDAA